MHKGLRRHLPTDREYSDVEAAYSVQVDYDDSATVTIAGYAALWGWSRGRVSRFLARLNVAILYDADTTKTQNQRGQITIQIADRSRTDNGQIRCIDSRWLGDDVNRKRTDNKQIMSRSRSTTINPDPDPEKALFDRGPTFDDFYRIYPKKKAKPAAEKAWKKLNPSNELFEQMLKALDWQKKQPDWVKENGQFIPLPATWLHGKRWLDEQPAATTEPTDSIIPCVTPEQSAGIRQVLERRSTHAAV